MLDPYSSSSSDKLSSTRKEIQKMWRSFSPRCIYQEIEILRLFAIWKSATVPAGEQDQLLKRFTFLAAQAMLKMPLMRWSVPRIVLHTVHFSSRPSPAKDGKDIMGQEISVSLSMQVRCVQMGWSNVRTQDPRS